MKWCLSRFSYAEEKSSASSRCASVTVASSVESGPVAENLHGALQRGGRQGDGVWERGETLSDNQVPGCRARVVRTKWNKSEAITHTVTAVRQTRRARKIFRMVD